MVRLMLSGAGTVVLLALASAVLMIANAPASPVAPASDAAKIGAPADAGTRANTLGRLVLTFEPASPMIDRN